MMHRLLPKGNFRIVLLFAVGIVMAQAIATVHLSLSNTAFYHRLKTIHASGYLTVPNIHVINHLTDFSAAFNGGLFFTFTSGCSLIILTFFVAWVWIRFLNKSKAAFFFLIIIWLMPIALVNQHGYSSLITLYLVCLPGLLFPLFCKLYPAESPRPATSVLWLHFFLFLLFAIGCGSQIKSRHFLDIRDFLLLDTSVGRKLNAFYYENSLYSANYFKSLNQKLIKTCNLQSIPGPSLRRQLTQSLLQLDYLPVDSSFPADLTVQAGPAEISLYHDGKHVLDAPINDFIRNPIRYTRQFETRTDRHAVFRTVTMISLLLTSAALLYGLFFILPFLITRLFLPPIWGTVTAGLMCLLAFYFLIANRNDIMLASPDQIAAALQSENPVSRIQALRAITSKNLDVFNFATSSGIAESPNIPERYWIAKALSRSRAPESRKILLQLLQDNHFNVVCMAAYSLGKRGERNNIQMLIRKIQSSRNWYVQWYAYKALRNLGWRQKQFE